MTTQISNILNFQISISRKIILEIMKKQDYNTTIYENFSDIEVNSMRKNNQLNMLLETNNEPNKKIYIKYFLNGKLTTGIIQGMVDELFITTQLLNKSSDTLFIICKDDINETLTNELKHIWERQGILIVIENIKQLQFNILEHCYVPPHYVMSDSEVEIIKQRYNINDFPQISRFDPVARVICLRPGQVCYIKRPSKTAIYTDFYRICI